MKYWLVSPIESWGPFDDKEAAAIYLDQNTDLDGFEIADLTNSGDIQIGYDEYLSLVTDEDYQKFLADKEISAP